MKKLIIAAGLLMTTSAYAQTEVLTGLPEEKTMEWFTVFPKPK